MGRPSADVLNETTRKNRLVQIIKAKGLWTVFYKDEPMNVKYTSPANSAGADNPKYPKVTFPAPGHAMVLARRMNALFNCDDFKVVQLLGDTQTYSITINAMDTESIKKEFSKTDE